MNLNGKKNLKLEELIKKFKTESEDDEKGLEDAAKQTFIIGDGDSFSILPVIVRI